MKKIILKAAPKKQKSEKTGKGFYALVFVAIVTVGTTGYIMRTRNDAIAQLENAQTRLSQPETISIEEIMEQSETPPITVSNGSPVPEKDWQSDDVIPVSNEIIQKNTEEPADEEIPVSASVTEITHLLRPAPGEVLKGHSDTELTYSKTLEDWRLHKGADIKAPIGTTVIAAAKGTVSECYSDNAYGKSIIIDHGNGFLTKYSNLSSTDMVDVGKEVDAGDAIGVVGDTAEFEIADEAHLHFEVIKDGRSTDPEQYFE